MIIKIDVDNVIRDLSGSICSVYNEISGSLDNMEPCDFHVYNLECLFPKINGMLPSEYFFLERGKDVFLDKAKPINGAKEAIDRLKDSGNKIILCTWQMTADNMMYTLEFLKRHDIQFDDIFFSKEKYLVKGDYLIDDNIEFLVNPNEEAEKIIIDQPYNRWFHHEDFKRVYNLADAADYILKENHTIKNFSYVYKNSSREDG